MSNCNFSKDFVWGAATAAFQIEGATCEDGRGESIWDRFCKTAGNVLNMDNGDIACDHYHKYKDDIQLMKNLGIRAYRLSISWPRILPDGKGQINKKGLDFYKRLIEELLNNDITPYVTLYHWDLPQKLQDIGGWDNRDVVEYFVEYANIVFDNLGDMVKNWTTINEPFCVSHVSNSFGQHAPGFKDYALGIRTSHNISIAHGKAVELFRSKNFRDSKIGVVLNVTPTYPADDSEENIHAAYIQDGFNNRWFLDSYLRGEYPKDMLELFEKALWLPDIREGDMDLLKNNPVDLVGINYYTRAIVKASSSNFPLNCETLPPKKPVTAMNWEVYPNGLYEFLLRMKNDYNNPEIYITENGCAFDDVVLPNGTIVDEERVQYFKSHIQAVNNAIQEGTNIKGYFAWSLMDNFEWALGYSKRFGIIHVDYKTQKRTFKESAKWYKEVIKNNGFSK